MAQLGDDEALAARRAAVDRALASRQNSVAEVWIVFDDAYGDCWVSGVYDSKAKAARWVAENGPPLDDWHCVYRIEKHSVT
jgi:hypothetical protein